MNPLHIPMKTIGPVKITGQEVNDEVNVPLATYETPLWPSTNRGAKVSRLCGGFKTYIVSEKMCRSVVVEADNIAHACICDQALKDRFDDVAEVVKTTSRFARLQSLHTQIVGRLIYIRIEITSGDASGHNMVTKAADAVLAWLLGQYEFLTYVSISGNFCTDKKVSAVNGILGRGKYVVSEAVISREICENVLKTTPQAIVDLNIKKNLIGTSLAGGLRSANAHFANILLASYLATGQDAANIIEGSQGMVHAEIQGEDLYFSVTLPNLIVGTVGNGKGLPMVEENLEKMGCKEERASGKNARRLAIIIAAAVMCGDLSLMAAQTNPGELMRAHEAFERG